MLAVKKDSPYWEKWTRISDDWRYDNSTLGLTDKNPRQLLTQRTSIYIQASLELTGALLQISSTMSDMSMVQYADIKTLERMTKDSEQLLAVLKK